jgi:dimethylamine/trimethylamine dehydrogenase
MARDHRYDVLFEPVRIGPKILRNRFVQVPQCTGFGSEKPGAQARHRAIKAEGGWAAVCTEYCSIGPESDYTPSVSARLWDDDDVRNLAPMCAEVHAFGSLAGVELWHGGVEVSPSETRMVPRAPTQVPSDGLHYSRPLTYPREMDRADIREVQQLYVAAARRAMQAGFDIIYVYGADSYLPIQFLSTYYNKRTDEYGGSLENRARFWIETLELVREVAGDSCAIAARLAVEGLGAKGVGLDEGLAFVELADHLVDLWDVKVGSRPNVGDTTSSRFAGENWQAKWTSQVKAHTVKPVVGVGRITSPDTMVKIIESGQWDLIGAARPSIADPFLPRKIEEGRLDEIRECVGNNICTLRANWGQQIACTQNATAGEEYRRGWHPERFAKADNADRDVLVVGAGPAGMECAIVLARRGMRRVHLVDAAPALGGHLLAVARLPGLGEWARIVNYRQIQLDKLRNVEVILRTRLDAAAVREYGAEIVVIATGARWATDGLNHVTNASIPGAEGKHVLAPENVLDDPDQAGEHVLVYDAEGYFMGAGLAELLAARGRHVTLASPHGAVSPMSDLLHEGIELRQHLRRDCGVALKPQTRLVAIQNDNCVLRDENESEFQLSVDTVVLVTMRIPNDSLLRELRSDSEALTRERIEGAFGIGDCVAPRLLADCIFDGHRLGREIDSAQPGTPLPFLRERCLAPVKEPADQLYTA